MKSLPRLLAVSLLGFVSAFAQTPAVNPAAVPTLRNEWLVRVEGLNAIAQKGGVDLLFVGDSITEAWKNQGRLIWTERYAPLHAANFGIGGDRTEHVLWRLQNGNLEGIKPKVVVLLAGTNNTARDTGAQIAEGVAAIVKEIRTRLPETKILLLAVFPRGERPDMSVRAKILEINKTITALDDGKRVFFLSINEKFIQADGTLSKDIMPDFLHLSRAGYQIWADAMQPKLDELMK